MLLHSKGDPMILDIQVTHVNPPIPMRNWDYQAATDNYDGAPDAGWQLVGSGPTAFRAVLDLYDQWEVHMGDEPLVMTREMFEEDINTQED
jgi:hypothetical protein